LRIADIGSSGKETSPKCGSTFNINNYFIRLLTVYCYLPSTIKKPNIIMTTQEKTMTTQEVADRFFELAQEGKFDEIQDELYDESVKSVEPATSTWQNVEGFDQVKEKAKQWQSIVEEMHGGYTNKPQVAGNFFSCAMGMDVTVKGQPRMKMDEIAVYEVRDGKIVLEQFFF
jgi:ketosteroid isomerase-like protein